MKKLVKIGVDGETIGKIIDATTDDQPEGVSISNDKIGKLLIINILTYSKTFLDCKHLCCSLYIEKLI